MNASDIKTMGFVPTDKEMAELYKTIGEQKIVVNRHAVLTGPQSKASGSIDYISAVNDDLNVSYQLTDAERTMTDETKLWIQHVSTGIAKQAGWSDQQLADPKQRSTSTFWNFVCQALLNYTPWCINNYNVYDKYATSQQSGQINVAQIVQTVVNVVLGPEAAAKMAELGKLLGSGDNSVGVTNVANFWWNHKSLTQSDSNWTMSPIIKDLNGNCQTSYAFCYMSETRSDWRALFVQSHYESFSLDISGLGIQWSVGAWQQAKPQVEAKLSQWLNNSITGAPIG